MSDAQETQPLDPLRFPAPKWKALHDTLNNGQLMLMEETAKRQVVRGRSASLRKPRRSARSPCTETRRRSRFRPRSSKPRWPPRCGPPAWNKHSRRFSQSREVAKEERKEDRNVPFLPWRNLATWRLCVRLYHRREVAEPTGTLFFLTVTDFGGVGSTPHGARASRPHPALQGGRDARAPGRIVWISPQVSHLPGAPKIRDGQLFSSLAILCDLASLREALPLRVRLFRRFHHLSIGPTGTGTRGSNGRAGARSGRRRGSRRRSRRRAATLGRLISRWYSGFGGPDRRSCTT